MEVVVVVDGEDDEDGAEVSSLEVRPSDKESLSVPRVHKCASSPPRSPQHPPVA